MRKTIILLIMICLVTGHILGVQSVRDSIGKDQRWNFHFQTTAIDQYHGPFRSNYIGKNSLYPGTENTISLSATLFFGRKLWNGAEVYFNPELSGGSGFSKTTGIAGFPNGEIYRVSNPAPHIYVGRLYLKQIIPLGGLNEFHADEQNQLASRVPDTYLAFIAGKYSVLDFFDNNRYSHDPRTQFFNWSLMGNPAWDYPANTRGYTYGITLELVKHLLAIRFSSSMVPITANDWIMDPSVGRSRSDAVEYEHKYKVGNRNGIIRFIAYLTHARMGNYPEAIRWGIARNLPPEIDSVRKIGRAKYGFGINLEQEINKNIGLFLRSSWNDGQTETWAFTEIDRHLSAGLVFNGSLWQRKNDNLGIALIINGLSKDHREYLESGGNGFIIGDGNLNYSPELIGELYYSLGFPHSNWWLSPDFQLVVNPAYNQDRGPVTIFGVRSHIEF